MAEQDQNHLALLPERAFAVDDPEITTVRPGLTLTLYLDYPLSWARAWTVELFESFLHCIDPADLRCFMTSSVPGWRHLSEGQLPELTVHLGGDALRTKVRHLLLVKVVDDPHCPSTGFVYREVDPSLCPLTGYIQIFFPAEHSPDDLMALAIQVCQQYRIVAGLGGFHANWNPMMPENSFRMIHTWSRRFAGLDVQHPELMSSKVTGGLPGASWLTLIGSAADTQGGLVESITNQIWERGVNVMPLANATLVRAGDRPELGDVNALEFPSALAEVSQVLAPSFVEDVSLPGPFAEPGQSDAWRRRFSDPEVWR